MKKVITILSAFALLMTLTTSCNKKLKEDMDDLEKSLNDQKAKNDNLQNQVNTLNGILVRTPVSVQFSTRDNDDASVSWQGDLSYVAGSDYTQSLIGDLDNGNYYVYLWRGGDLGTDFYTRIEFLYNTTTKAVSSVSARYRGYGAVSGDYINANFNGTTEITHNVTVNTFDYNAGTISFNYSAITTGAYSNNVYSGKGMSVSIQYSGAMAKSEEVVL